ncbi:hypothetical protein EG329_010160 [Mollisiaceae sp. DMI_Dod_QoI]|nr:hypothetical protein EG329_010160 [Helotiales sp. DMI_Dod_QoI]
MATFRRGSLIVQPDSGLKVNHRLQFLIDAPIQKDLPPTAENFVAFAMPQHVAWSARQQTIRDLNLVEDAFGFFHTRGHNLFSFDDFREYLKGGIDHGVGHGVIHGDVDRRVVHGVEHGAGQRVGPGIDHGGVGIGREHTLHMHVHEGMNGGAHHDGEFISSRQSQGGSGPGGVGPDQRAHRQGGIVSGEGRTGLHSSVVTSDPFRSSEDMSNPIFHNNFLNTTDSGEKRFYHRNPKKNGRTKTQALAVCNDAPDTEDGPKTMLSQDSDNKVIGRGEQIVSEENPDFAEIAKSLSEYKKTKGIHHPNTGKRVADAPFRPSRMVQEETAGFSQPAEDHQYLGDTKSKSYTSQIRDLADDVNCCLWVTMLPPDVSEKEFLAVIDTGAVFAVHINQPNPTHPCCAAKLVFMKHTAAVAFLIKCNSQGGIRIRGNRIRAIWNTHGYMDYDSPEKSRVLRIRGPTKFMNKMFWERYFKACAVYQISHTTTIGAERPSESILEVGFARLDGQAETMYHAIRKEKLFKGIFWVEYSRDPCDPEGIDFMNACAASRQARN